MMAQAIHFPLQMPQGVQFSVRGVCCSRFIKHKRAFPSGTEGNNCMVGYDLGDVYVFGKGLVLKTASHDRTTDRSRHCAILSRE